MPTISIQPITIADIEHAPNVGELLGEYAEESGLPGLGGVHAQWDIYHNLEDSGALCSIGAYDDEKLIGFVNLIVGRRPHYAGTIASIESFFVSSSARKSGAGLLLLSEVERTATDLGANGIFLNAANDSRLDKLLTAKDGYENTHKVFHKVLP